MNNVPTESSTTVLRKVVVAVITNMLFQIRPQQAERQQKLNTVKPRYSKAEGN